MSAVSDRNTRLDALVSATTAWATQRQNDINQRVATSKLILQGRTGSERLAQASVSAASDLVVSSIDDFLLA
jgi:hypothetical protein